MTKPKALATKPTAEPALNVANEAPDKQPSPLEYESGPGRPFCPACQVYAIAIKTEGMFTRYRCPSGEYVEDSDGKRRWRSDCPCDFGPKVPRLKALGRLKNRPEMPEHGPPR